MDKCQFWQHVTYRMSIIHIIDKLCSTITFLYITYVNTIDKIHMTFFFTITNRLRSIFSSSQFTLTICLLFWPPTYNPALTISMVWTLTKSWHFCTTYLPYLVNVVCERPPRQKHLIILNILLTSSNNQISKFRIPNIYNEIFVLIFLMILRTHFEASLRFRKN